MPRRTVLRRLSLAERAETLRGLRTETKGGLLLLAATVVALVWANSPASAAYEHLREFAVGPEALHLHLTLDTWAADGLLAVFFLVAGLELKRELVVGRLRSPADALLPVAAALGGMVLPALLYLAFVAGEPALAGGWAVPMATDIAFALAVLAVAAPSLPASLRAFLLTLAVVDDLGAILVIATVYSAHVRAWPLVAAAVLLGVLAWLQRRRVSAWWVYVPLGLTAWALVHAGGVHATVAGVAIGLLVRVRPDPGEQDTPATRLEHRLHPFSAYLAVPVFALFAAGVDLADANGLATLVTSRVAVAVALALVLGKALGVWLAAYGTARFTRAQLSPELGWSDVAGLAVLSGMGFTVSLLLSQLAFGSATLVAEAKVGVLAGSLVAALLATGLLRRRSDVHHRAATPSDPDEDEAVG